MKNDGQIVKKLTNLKRHPSPVRLVYDREPKALALFSFECASFVVATLPLQVAATKLAPSKEGNKGFRMAHRGRAEMGGVVGVVMSSEKSTKAHCNYL